MATLVGNDGNDLGQIDVDLDRIEWTEPSVREPSTVTVLHMYSGSMVAVRARQDDVVR